VPPQRIENGVIRFDVLLARIVGFQVRGDAGKSERMIEAYLQEIRKQPVFNLFEAERYLLLARDIPGLDVRMTLRPAGTAAGEVIGDVQLLRTPIELDANIQNSGSKEAGRFAGLAQLRLNGLLGAGDRTIVGGYSTADFEEQTVIQIGQEFRIGREGLTIAGDFTHAWTRPTIDPAIDLRTRTLVASLQARYPIVRRQTRNLFGSLGFDAINQRTRFNTLPLTRDRLRVLYGRLDFDAIDELSLGTAKGYSPAEPRWRAAGSIELRQGLGIFGASKSCGAGAVACGQPGTTPPSRLAADTTAFLVRAGGLVETRPVPAFAISVSPRIQYARRPLLSYEEFSAGNFTVGRGYDPGTLIGDSGAGIVTELRLGSLVPNSARDAAFQAYVFMDSAWVWNRDRIAGTTDPQRLVSTGAGLRVVQGNRVNLDVAGAVPLKRAGLQTERGDLRLLVNLSVRLLPWKRR
jgi:hemolysin activation/secretion protein